MKNKIFSLISVSFTLLSIMLLMISLHSCGIKKTTQPKENTDIIVPKSYSVNDFLNSYIVYTSFSSKSKVEISSPQINHSLTIKTKSIYKQKTHLSIIASVIGMNMEAAQAHFTSDSIHVLDKINTNYYEVDWSASEQLLKMPLRFDLLQNLLVGNPAFIQSQYKNFNIESGKAIITQEISPYTQVLYFDTSSKKLEMIYITISNSPYTFSISLSDYRIDSQSGIPFATRHHWIVTDGNAKHELMWRYEEFSFNTPVTINFSIPFRYKKASLY